MTMYVRFSLSLRNVEDLLAERGIAAYGLQGLSRLCGIGSTS
jgi:hypothetical protein